MKTIYFLLHWNCCQFFYKDRDQIVFSFKETLWTALVHQLIKESNSLIVLIFFLDQLRSYPYILFPRRSMNKWRRWHDVKSYGLGHHTKYLSSQFPRLIPPSPLFRVKGILRNLGWSTNSIRQILVKTSQYIQINFRYKFQLLWNILTLF